MTLLVAGSVVLSPSKLLSRSQNACKSTDMNITLIVPCSHQWKESDTEKSLVTTGFQLGLIQYDSDHVHTVLAPNGKTNIKFRAFKSIISTYIVLKLKCVISVTSNSARPFSSAPLVLGSIFYILIPKLI